MKPGFSGRLLAAVVLLLLLRPQEASAVDRQDCMKDPVNCSTLIQADPNDVDLLLLRAAGYESKGKWDKAVEDYSTAVGLDPGDPDLFARKGKAEKAAGLDFAANMSYGKASELDPANAEYPLLAAAATCSDSEFDRVLKKNPKNADGYLLAAICLQRKSSVADLAKAEKLETRAIALKPDFAAAYYNRALLYVAKRDDRRALADLDSLQRIDADNADIHTLRGVIFGAQGDAAAAVKEHGKAIVADPLNAQRYLFRARVLFNVGKMDAALADAKRAIMLDGKSASAYQTKGKIEEATGNKSGAEMDLMLAAGPEYLRTAATRMETTPAASRDDSSTSVHVVLVVGAIGLAFFMFLGRSAAKSPASPQAGSGSLGTGVAPTVAQTSSVTEVASAVVQASSGLGTKDTQLPPSTRWEPSSPSVPQPSSSSRGSQDAQLPPSARWEPLSPSVPQPSLSSQGTQHAQLPPSARWEPLSPSIRMSPSSNDSGDFTR